jgi:hypothetical protein
MNEKLSIKTINQNDCVLTTFNCSIENRDKLEELINEYYTVYSSDEIVNALLSFALKEIAEENF